MPTGMAMQDSKFDPNEVSKIKTYLWMDPTNVHLGKALKGIELYNRNNSIVLMVGDCNR